MQEIELKLRLLAHDVVPLRARLDRLAPPRTVRIDNTYFDTPDDRLARARAALRLRCVRDGRRRTWVQTFKTDASVEAALAVRGEWETPAPGGRIQLAALADSPLHELLAPGAAGTALAAVFRTDFERTTWEIHTPGAVIEVALDLGVIEAGGRREAICELELELLSGPSVALFDLALALAGDGGRGGGAPLSLLPFAASKAARGYRLARDEAPRAHALRRASVSRLFDGSQRTGAAARLWVGHAMNAFLANVVVLERTAGVDCIHQARVALRRLRAGLELLGPGAQLPVALRDAVRRWSGRLGLVREWDVLCQSTLPALGAQAPAQAQAAWTRIRAGAAARRATAMRRLAREVASPAFARFVLEMLRWSAAPPSRPGKRVSVVLPAALVKGRRLLADAMAGFPRMTIERQHKLRIRAKNLRYGIELAGALRPARMNRDYQRELARFQEAAGGLRDADHAIAIVPRLTRSATAVAHASAWAQQHLEQHRERAANSARLLRRAR